LSITTLFIANAQHQSSLSIDRSAINNTQLKRLSD
jgi:hypothetical protein